MMPRGGMSPAALHMYQSGTQVQELAEKVSQSSAYVSLQLSGQRRLTDAVRELLDDSVLELIPEYERR